MLTLFVSLTNAVIRICLALRRSSQACGTNLIISLGRFRLAEEAVSAIEFAIYMPVLVLVMVGGFQIITYLNAVRKIDLVARSISEMISQATPPTTSTVATVNATDLHFSYDSAMVLFPYVLKDSKRQGISWWQNISINFASIQFTQTSTACTTSGDLSACYTANVVWTSTGTAQPSSGPNYRPCSPAQIPADNTASPKPTTLPRSVYGPASLVVIDVVFTFVPTFGQRIVPAARMARSAYVQPRYATLINYDTTNNDGIATKCPGY